MTYSEHELEFTFAKNESVNASLSNHFKEQANVLLKIIQDRIQIVPKYIWRSAYRPNALGKLTAPVDSLVGYRANFYKKESGRRIGRVKRREGEKRRKGRRGRVVFCLRF